MKLDHGMHIGMHLVSFGKSGVTQVPISHPLKEIDWIIQLAVR
jgi:hypothetical protein